MIKAQFTRRANRQLQNVVISGHAGSGPYGYDLVCAAVSTLAINFINSLVEIAKIEADIQINEIEGGYLAITLPDSLDPHTQERVHILFESFLLGMTNLSDNEPRFVTTQVTE